MKENLSPALTQRRLASHHCTVEHVGFCCLHANQCKRKIDALLFVLTVKFAAQGSFASFRWMSPIQTAAMYATLTGFSINTNCSLQFLTLICLIIQSLIQSYYSTMPLFSASACEPYEVSIMCVSDVLCCVSTAREVLSVFLQPLFFCLCFSSISAPFQTIASFIGGKLTAGLWRFSSITVSLPCVVF